MIYFTSDYICGAHPKVLEHLIETNEENLTGYGEDKYSLLAAEKIRKACNCENAQVYFIAGGTQTNQTVISTVLKEYEGVVACETGHVSGHEAGAIEYTGHKVITIKGENGKLPANALRSYVETFYKDENHDHMVFPGMVYISFPTEYGTIYTKEELKNLHGICKEFGMSLFIDGARLGYGLASKAADITLDELAGLCDVFYIGGTKVGALCGEAVVFTHNNAPKHFMTMVKQHGAMLAKGRLLSVQFDALFTDDLYMQISRHAIDMAEKLKNVFEEKGYQFFKESPTNQQFIVLENNKMEELRKNVQFGFWEKYDDSHTVVRFATGWSTSEEDIRGLRELL